MVLQEELVMTDVTAFSPRPASAPSDDGLVADLITDDAVDMGFWNKPSPPPRIVFPAFTRAPDPPTRREVVRLARKLEGRERDLLRHGSRAAKRASRSG